MRWLLVRHGESEANAGGWLAGHVDAGLTARGRDQASALAAPLGAALPIDRVFTSDLARARDTARIAAAGLALPVWEDARLRERDVGEWEGLDRERMRAIGAMRRLISWDDGPPGGESQEALARRVLPWLVERAGDGGTTLVVAHGGVIRVAVGLLDGAPTADIGRWTVGNAEVVVREADRAAWARALDRIRR